MYFPPGAFKIVNRYVHEAIGIHLEKVKFLEDTMYYRVSYKVANRKIPLSFEEYVEYPIYGRDEPISVKFIEKCAAIILHEIRLRISKRHGIIISAK